MPNLLTARANKNTPVRDEAGLHGAVIPGALIYQGTVVVLDMDTVHDAFVRVVGGNPPINPDGTYLKTGKQAWVELNHFIEANTEKSNFQVEVDWTNRTFRILG